ncbi:MAG TPA: M15 family metallopeptidase [Longimicrobiales bacterium]|nr:M15 family metallopeptidase [Longimicrobiales bacterium]
MGWLPKGIALSLGLAVIAATVPSPTPEHAPVVPEGSEVRATPTASLRSDTRVLAFTQAYAALIDSVAYGEEDVVFHLGDGAIHFRDGRMLEADRGAEGDAECDPIFYEYPLEPLADPPTPSEETPVYCTDLLEALWGSEEDEIREHGSSIGFLDHKMFVNDFLIEPLTRVERDLRRAARRDAEVAEWIAEVDITYSFVSRRIAGSPSRSHHGWGLAVDFVPESYDGQHVYWRWSRALDRRGWDRIPLEERWSPPLAVVEIFERQGFVWGGKWARFDMIHFEYRPEIILYNRLLSLTES